MTTDKMKCNGSPVLETYRGWNVGRDLSGYCAENPSNGCSCSALNLSSVKKMVRRTDVGDVKLTKGTPSPEGAVYHYTTYRGESFTVRRRKLWSKSGMCWNVFPDAGENKGRLVHVGDRLQDVRDWLQTYQVDQMLDEDKDAAQALVQRIKADLIVAAMQVPETPELCKRIEENVDRLAAMVRVD